MKMRYLLIVSLILTIMTLGAVSASENVTDVGLAEDIEIDDSISEIDDSAQEEEILAESGQDIIGDYYDGEIDIEFDDSVVVENASEKFYVMQVCILYSELSEQTFNFYVNGNFSYNLTHLQPHNVVGVYSTNLGINDYGEYKIDVYLGNTFLTSSNVFVSPYTFNIEATDVNDDGHIEYQDIVEYRIELPYDANGTATIVVNGKSYDVSLIEGEGRAFISTDGWNLGDNTVVVTYNGDGKYNKLSRKYTTYVEPKVSFPSMHILSSNLIILSVGEQYKITFIAPDTANGMVEVSLIFENGTSYTQNVTVSNGRGSYLLSNIPEGDYYLFINGKIGNTDIDRNIGLYVINNSDKFAVSLSPTQITVGDFVKLNVKAPFASVIFISVDDSLMKLLVITEDSTSDLISGLTVGTHVIKLVGVNMYDGDFYSNTYNVVVKDKPIAKKATKIIASKKTFKVKTKTKKYTITLKAGTALVKKVKVTLKVKGKTYKATTNTKGKATFKITKLAKKGTFKAVIKFAGDKVYKASSKTVKITVK